MTGHMLGFDPAKSPTFTWPKHPKEAGKITDGEIKKRTEFEQLVLVTRLGRSPQQSVVLLRFLETDAAATG